jgi:hypothetical protein
MINPHYQISRSPDAAPPGVTARPAHSGGTLVPPSRQRSLQPTSEAEKSPRERLRHKRLILTAARRQAAKAVTRAIPPAPDPLAP